MTLSIFFLLLTFFGTIVSQNSVNPITSLCPFRTGSAQFFEFTISSTFTILFDSPVNFQPSNTLVGFNSIQYKTTNNSIMNIGIISSISNLSQYTQILITLTLTYPQFYSRVSISFFTANQAWNAFKFTPIQWSQVQNTTNLLDIILGLLSPDTSVYNISGAPPSNNGIVINKLKMLCQSSPCEMAPRMTSNTNINVNLKNIQTSSVNFQFSMITVNSSYTSNSTYGLQWGFSEQNISSSIYSSAKFALAGESDSSKFFFYGANSFSWNTKDQLSFRFQSDMQNYKFYNWVSNASYNYFEIFSIYFIFTQCVDPTHPNLLYRQQQCYDICPQGYYVTPLKRCLLCNLPNCTSCDSINNCILCDSSFSFIIVSGVCTQCNPDPTNVSSLLPLCVEEQPEPEPEPEPEPQPQPQPEPQPEPQPQPEPKQNPSQNQLINQQTEQCFLSNFNKKTQKCDAIQQAQKITFTLANIAATPTIGLFTKVFVELIGLLDDLSYYSYHNRNYTKAITVYLQLMTDFTLERFLPSPLNQTYSQLSLFYSQRILKNDLERSPSKFVKNDGDVYFLKNTQSYWIGSVILSVFSFGLLSFANWSTNKCVHNKLLKRYNYFGMIAIDLLGCNIQYLSFRCFSQLYQSISLGCIYYVNLNSCYLLLFFIILYSASSVIVFETFYNKLQKSFIINELFGQSCKSWFVISNFLRCLNGFVHAFFYDYPFFQTLLLTISFAIKASVYTFTIKLQTNKLKYTFEVISSYLMVLLQIFFLAQLFVMQRGDFSHIEDHLGNIEVVILAVNISNRLLSTLILPMRDIIMFLKGVDLYEVRKKVVDIKIQRFQRHPTFQIKDDYCQKDIKNSHPSKNEIKVLKPKIKHKRSPINTLKETYKERTNKQNRPHTLILQKSELINNLNHMTQRNSDLILQLDHNNITKNNIHNDNSNIQICDNSLFHIPRIPQNPFCSFKNITSQSNSMQRQISSRIGILFRDKSSSIASRSNSIFSNSLKF